MLFFLLFYYIELTLNYGKQTYVVGKNEMILLKKATSVKFEMIGDTENDNIYDGTMICIQDGLLKEFITTANDGRNKNIG